MSSKKKESRPVPSKAHNAVSIIEHQSPKSPQDTGAVIRFNAEHADKGFAVLFSRGQVGVVGEDTYAVGPEHIASLQRSGIPYEVVAL